MATKRTYQPSKVKRARTHGFLVRSRTKGCLLYTSPSPPPRGPERSLALECTYLRHRQATCSPPAHAKESVDKS